MAINTAQKVDSLALILKATQELIDKTPPQLKWVHTQRLKYFQRVFDAYAKGEPVAWAFLATYPEIFYAMGITPLCPESFAGALRQVPGYETVHYKWIDAAHEHMVADYECYLQKVLIGAALSGDLPKPSVIVHSSQPCDSATGGYPAIAHVLGVPHFCIDVPYWKNERTFEYVGEEMLRLASYLEELTGRKLEDDKLAAVLKEGDRAQEYILKINELRKAVPCPISSNVPFSAMAFSGTPEFADYCQTGYQWAKARYDKGQSHSGKPEKKRIVWIATGVGFDTGLADWMEKEWGAVSVMGMFSHYRNDPISDYSDRKAVLRGMGKKLLEIPMGWECRGPGDYFIDASLDKCKEYKADAAIFSGNVGCKNMWAIVKLVKDKIESELGIPMLVFEVDMGDSRFASVETIRARIKDFMDTMVV